MNQNKIINPIVPEQKESEFRNQTQHKSIDPRISPEFRIFSEKITDKLEKHCLKAFLDRMPNGINEFINGTSSGLYTLMQDRLDRIKDNYEQYNIVKRNRLETANRTPFGETFLAVEEQVDDLLFLFKKIDDNLSINDRDNNLGGIQQYDMSIESSDYDNKSLATLNELKRQVTAIKQAQGEEIAPKTANFTFKNKELVKKIVLWAKHKSGFNEILERYFLNGVITGTFILKETFLSTEDKRLTMYSNNYDSYKIVGDKVVEETRPDNYYKLYSPDLRNIITDKKGSWVIEKNHTTTQELLRKTFDTDNKPLPNPVYDPDKLKEAIASMRWSMDTSRNNDSDSTMPRTNYQDLQDLYEINDEVTIYECHNIPIILEVQDGKKKKKVFVKSMMTFIEIDEKAKLIQVQKTPYIDLPYHFVPFVMEEGDIYGKGLPELVKYYQESLDHLWNYAMDIAQKAAKSNTVHDANAIVEIEKIKNLGINESVPIRLKSAMGKNIKDMIQSLPTNIEVLPTLVSMIEKIQEQFRRVSRKGATAEKVRPDPSATEFSSMMNEVEKILNRLKLRLQDGFNIVLKRMYLYITSQRKEEIRIQAMSERKALGEEETLAGRFGDMYPNRIISKPKSIKITPTEMFFDDVEFDIQVVDNEEKEAIDKQQTMQLVQTLANLNAINPEGEPKVYIDDNNSQKQINEYFVMKKLLNAFDLDEKDGFKDIVMQPMQQLAGQQMPMADEQGQGPTGLSVASNPNPPAPPTLMNTATENSQLLGGVQNIR